ncbi:hypothetical protein BJX70DRAFT_396207 [Aspergillus crustosus]
MPTETAVISLHAIALALHSASTSTPPTFSPQDHYDYDYNEQDIFRTGLTPDSNWINLNLPVSASGAGAGACPTDVAGFNLNLPVSDGSWMSSLYESSMSTSTFSTPTPGARSSLERHGYLQPQITPEKAAASIL